jgi:hypothetical protein
MRFYPSRVLSERILWEGIRREISWFETRDGPLCLGLDRRRNNREVARLRPDKHCIDHRCLRETIVLLGM